MAAGAYILLALLLLVALVLGCYLSLYRWLQRRWGQGAGISLLVITHLMVGYSMYNVTTYKSDGFYRDEYERITLRPFPESAQLSTHESTGTSSATYPSLNQIWALLKVSPQEYRQLQKQLAQDARFSSYPCIVSRLHHGSRPFQLNLDDTYACGEYAYGYARRNQSQLLYIGFVTDSQSLVILSLDSRFIPSNL